MDLVTHADVTAAAERIADTVKRTPVDSSRTYATRADADSVRLKLETLQRTGSFKLRGAANRIRQLDETELARGVVAASGGNHAQGVALAAATAGADATIVMPAVTPTAKIEATRSYGATVEIHGEVYQDAYEKAKRIADERGATFVHPFDDPAVIAGQGTLGLELAEAVPDLDTVLVAIGGGGLISGVATALAPTDARVIGVQTKGASHMAKSLARGEVHERESIDTIAEGIAASRTEPYTFRHVRERVDRVVTVTDEATCAAMALTAERAKLVTESAGSVALAALLADRDGSVGGDGRLVDVTDETIAVPICGANTDLTTFAEHTRRGLAALGRYEAFRLAVADWPASLAAVSQAVDAAGGTVDELRRTDENRGVAPTETAVTVSVESSGPSHLDGIRAELDATDGLRVVGR